MLAYEIFGQSGCRAQCNAHLLSVAYVVDFDEPHLRPSDRLGYNVLGLRYVGRRDVPRIGDTLRAAGVLQVVVVQAVGDLRVFEDSD